MKNYNLLVVEDIDSVRLMICRMITRLFNNIDVVSLDNGEDAVYEVQSNTFGLIFLDVNLGAGGINGIETLMKIKEINPDQNVYMVTGYSITEEQNKIINANSLGILKKPFQLEELSDIINKITDK